jgi:RNA polymerase sigma-70 factor (ECF subfamily)
VSRARSHEPLPSPPRDASRPLAPACVERLRAGEAGAFDEVYAAYHVRLHGFLLRLSREPALARDLAQETWLRLAANARRLVPGSDPGAWLFTVARNLYLSRRRWALLDRARRLELFVRDGERSAPSPLEHACRDELKRAVERALAALALPEREVILLVCVEGFGAHEVAVMLDLSPAAVRKRLSRARARMLSQLPADLIAERRTP